MVETDIERVINTYAEAILADGMPLAGIAVYGSQARGTVHSESDIDVVVILNDYDPENERAISKRLWQLTLKADSRLEPVLCTLDEWTGPDCRPIIAAARTEGVEVVGREHLHAA